MKFDKLVKSVLENTTMASVGMAGGDTVFSHDSYATGDARRPGLVGAGTIIRRNKPELITTTLFKNLSTTKKPKRRRKHNKRK